jgi:formate hydrogenlyase subunit 3/multisubunit Na+/H+ antiporter MnhD subunit
VGYRMSILEDLNDVLVVILNILIFIVTINISIKRYKKSLNTYWTLLVMTLLTLIFAFVSDKYFDSFFNLMGGILPSS